MKKLLLILAVVFINASLSAQSPPQTMSYQAVIRNSSNALVTSTTVGMQITILQGLVIGGATPVYVETQQPSTNVNGLVSIAVGAGTVVAGTFSAINWANGPFYIKTEIDPVGGTNYSIMGTTQLLSVPYALYAQTAGNGITAAQAASIVNNTAKVGIIPGTSPGQMLYWDGSSWITVTPGVTGQNLTFCHGVPTWGPCPLIIGDSYQGGLIFYIFQPGDIGYIAGETHGLIAAPNEPPISQGWGCYGTSILGGDGTAVGTGYQNTIDIVSSCSDVGVAAVICNDYVENGYSDWYLPSRDELALMYSNLKLANLGNFKSSFYWSSSEYSATQAWYCDFGSGMIGYSLLTKMPICTVRPARSF